MSNDLDKQNSKKREKGGPETIAGYLASALDMEEEISNSVYRDYMNREYWPNNLEADAFESIRRHLAVLINDTARHKKMILELQKQRADDTKSK